MPSPSELLAGLAATANDWIAIAVVWHIVLAGVLIGVAAGSFRPRARMAAWMTCAPLVSVSALALGAHNPFNGATFALATVVVAAIAARLPAEASLAPPSSWERAAGASMIAFAWLYPHFLPQHPAWIYLFAAPVGLIPCPTLGGVIGLGLWARGFGSRAWLITIGGLGLFYGLFGALRLGVWLDLPLVFGALATLVSARAPRREGPALPG